MAPPPPWSDLPIELLQVIFERLTTDCLDLLRCRAVCTSWWTIATPIYRKLNPSMPPLLLIIPSEEGGCCYVFNPKTNLLHYLLSLETHGRWCLSSSFGWILTIGRDFPHEIRLLNPFTKAHIRLPPGSDFKDPQSLNVITSTSPSNPNCTVLVNHPYNQTLAFCKPGDEKWSIIRSNVLHDDDIFYNDKFYMVNHMGCILQFNPGGSPEVQLDSFKGPCSNHYLVESTRGDFLLAIRYAGAHPWPPHIFEVHKLDWSKRWWTRVRNLGDEAIFLSKRSSISVSTGRHSGGYWRPNCIYFVDDETARTGDRREFGVYNLGTKRWVCLSKFPASWTTNVSWMRPEI